MSSFQTPEKPKKPKASREVLALTGGKPQKIPTETFKAKRSNLITTPPPQATSAKKKQVEPKPKELVNKPIQKWEWKKIKSSTFPKNLQISHWEKVKPIPDKDYPFATLNIIPIVLQPTIQEYQIISSVDNKNWTMEETRELFDLCRRFDLRFTVIHDRFSSNHKKSIEELKRHYYTITRILQELRIKHQFLLSPIYDTNFDYGKKFVFFL
jgi:DNA methyltransferase 1-associated protein 1